MKEDGKMQMLKTKRIADDIRDTINWIAVFKTEYDLPNEVVEKLTEKLEHIAKELKRNNW